jgi:crotonobetainyl-CoA:carnitine CoA-transferase CaiB-like acyl-CoA transferase
VPGDYAVAMCFLPQDEAARDFAVKHFEEKFIAKEGQIVLGWRDVPTTLDGLGKAVIEQMPVIRQCFIGRGESCADQDAFERKLLAIRKQAQNPLAALAEKHGLPGLAEFYMPSASRRAPLSTRACCSQVRSAASMTICAIRCACRRWRWFTSVSRPTPSPAGSWRTPIASSRITAKSTRCAAT